MNCALCTSTIGNSDDRLDLDLRGVGIDLAADVSLCDGCVEWFAASLDLEAEISPTTPYAQAD